MRFSKTSKVGLPILQYHVLAIEDAGKGGLLPGINISKRPQAE